jgi:hypothetical protein
MKTLAYTHPVQFTFASFNFPKWHWSLPPRSLAKRLERYKNPVTGAGYILSPKPVTPGNESSFYYESDFCPSLRWRYCDDVNPRIDHTGWFCDEDGWGDKIRGIVGRLPKGRGFVAGWTMGEGMASGMDCTVYAEEREAANAADSMAERIAEREREYQEKARGEEEAKEEEEQADTLTQAFTF